MEEKKEEPIVDDAVEKLKIKKPKKKKFKETSEPVKVDLKELKEKAEEIIKVDLSKSAEEIKVPEKPVEEIKEEVVEVEKDKEEETPIVEEITSEEIVEEKVEEKIEPTPIQQEIKQPEKINLPENVEKLVNFMKETGGDINDYVRLNRDYGKMDNHTLLKEYYKTTKPHLSSEEVDFLMEDQFSYDEDTSDEKEIKRKKLALKEQVANAKTQLEELKSKHYQDIKLGSKLTKEQQKAVEFFDRYTKESEDYEKSQEQAKSAFLNKTDNVFNNKFKGFEYNVGDKRFRFNVKNIDKVKNEQSDISNFVKKFLNKDNVMEDASGYHKALYTAMNSDAIAKHFYEQGKADALKDSIAKSKNIDMNPRQQHSGEINVGGTKFRVLGDNTSDYKFKIKRKK